MSEDETAAARVAGEDVLGRRRFFANLDRARALGGNSLSGVLDVAGGAMLIASAVLVTLLLTHHASGRTREDDWLAAAVVAICGATCGLSLLALSRLVTYLKACAVLLATLSANSGEPPTVGP